MKKDTYIKYIEYTLGIYNKANKRQRCQIGEEKRRTTIFI